MPQCANCGHSSAKLCRAMPAWSNQRPAISKVSSREVVWKIFTTDYDPLLESERIARTSDTSKIWVPIAPRLGDEPKFWVRRIAMISVIIVGRA